MIYIKVSLINRKQTYWILDNSCCLIFRLKIESRNKIEVDVDVIFLNILK